MLSELSVSLRRITTRPRPFPSHGSILPVEPGSLSNFGLSRSLNFIALERERGYDPDTTTEPTNTRHIQETPIFPSIRALSWFAATPCGPNNAGINQAARGVFAARPGRGPRRGTAPEDKPPRLRWTEVTLPVLRPTDEGMWGLLIGRFSGRTSCQT